MHVTNAAAWGYFDLASNQWVITALPARHSKMIKPMLPRVCIDPVVVGLVSESASVRFGLKEGTPVVCSIGDNQAQVYAKLNALPCPAHFAEVAPRFHGERSDPSSTASIGGLTPSAFSIASLYHGLCAGIAENIKQLMPAKYTSSVTRLIGSGSALVRNRALQAHVERVFGLPVTVVAESDAAVGAALAAMSVTH